ncbi:longitudinals lacking protein, isoforms F/I/K/T-like isoform X4 [Phlebotomus papatasi]|uniref:longitudinals lacking protein, isoforms F/I/K/T-like isoform X4 n=1 Tax=Phlebotomus papatasi TaxID=29031 RepID=UPI0024841136|nr:longitudinals lacking protein, isoforms F/I/K/T-like isoform X4 [Phlebotomus papatasi]XP_055707987.1 longitudinals lacking protein, isoforms F/I/K/T-like isoform X4 [Phlebotomus papatasi]
MDDDQQFCLRWNNHQSTLISVFDTLLENGTLVDCTLAAEGKFLKAHKVVLSACSPYFAALLSQQYDKHPIFILKDVKFQELRAMMDYMYRGEVNISQDQLAALLKAAESLQIKGLSDSRGSGGSGGSSQKADTSTKTHASVPAAKTTAGLTIEQKRPRIEKQHPATIDMEPDVSDSREGSTSPNSRKRKKVRRRSIETNNIGDNHDQHSNSSSHSMPHAASSTHSTSMPTITSATSSASVLNVTKKTDHQSHESKGDIERDVDDNGDDGADGGESHQQPVVTRSKQSVSGDTDSVAGGVKDKMEHSTHSDMLLEPKNEYDESNEGNVEDLTLDDEELLDDLEQAGPSHGGEGSSQGYAQWQIERSQDEVFMGGQDSAGQHRDAQDVKPITFGDVLSGCLLENENIVVTQKNDKFVLLEINTPSTEKRKESAEDAKRAVITDLSDAKRALQEQLQKVSKPAAAAAAAVTTAVATSVVTAPPKVATKNHPRIKYSMKQPVPVALHKTLNKFELLNFSLSRKYGKQFGEAASVVSTTPNIGVTASSGNTTFTNTPSVGGGGSTLSVIETEIAKVPASIIIAPNSNKSSTINEDLQSSIMGDLSNYEIDDIELPDGTQMVFSDSTDSMDREQTRADSNYESRSADDTKFAFIEGRSLQNYEFSQSDSNDDVGRQYICRHCGKKYRWKSTLRRHENVECGGKEPMHQCPHCAYRAKQRGNLGVHIRKHHADMPQLETRRKHRSM